MSDYNLKFKNLKEGKLYEILHWDINQKVWLYYVIKNGLLYNTGLKSYSTLSQLEILELEFKEIKQIIIKKIIINKNTKMFFSSLDKKWKYVAKDFSGETNVYTDMPFKIKNEEYWDGVEDMSSVTGLIESDFDFLSYKDDEPMLIKDIVENSIVKKEEK